MKSKGPMDWPAIFIPTLLRTEWVFLPIVAICSLIPGLERVSCLACSALTRDKGEPVSSNHQLVVADLAVLLGRKDGHARPLTDIGPCLGSPRPQRASKKTIPGREWCSRESRELSYRRVVKVNTCYLSPAHSGPPHPFHVPQSDSSPNPAASRLSFLN